MPPVAEPAVGVVEKLAEPLGVDDLVERPAGRGAAPEVSVEPLGRVGVGGFLAWAAPIVNEGPDHADFARLAAFEKLHARNIVGRNRRWVLT